MSQVLRLGRLIIWKPNCTTLGVPQTNKPSPHQKYEEFKSQGKGENQHDYRVIAKVSNMASQTKSRKCQ